MELSKKKFNFEYFTSLPDDEKLLFLNKFNICTIYFAIDGTRRFAISKLKKLGKSFTYDNYFNLMKNTFIDSIQLLFDYGFSTVIVLLHDNTSINRGDEYMRNSVKLGMAPLWSDKDYLNFYQESKINVHFAGFNELYTEIGYPDLITKMNNLVQLTNSKENYNKLVFLTLTSKSEDILRLANKISQKNLIDKTTIVKDFYGFDIPDLDVSLYFGRPRSKVSPILINDNDLRIYTKLPSLYLNNYLLDQIVYFTILHKLSINDEYKKYRDTYSLKISESEFNPSLIWGDISYSSDLIDNLL